MCNKISCPLCCQKSFVNADVLKIALVEVTTKPLNCPLCNVICLGLDKLTIHLFAHGLVGNKTEREYKDLPEYTRNVLSLSETSQNELLPNNSYSSVNQNLFVCDNQVNKKGIIITNPLYTNDKSLETQTKFSPNIQNSNFTVVSETCPSLPNNQSFQQEKKPNFVQPVLINDSIINARIIPIDISLQSEACILPNEKKLEIDTNNFVHSQDKINSKITNPSQLGSPKFQLRPSPLEPIVTRLTNGERVPEQEQSNTNVEESVMDDDSLGNDVSFTNNSKTQCDLCGFHFDSEKLLAMHAFIAHENNSSLTRMELHACGLCEKTFRMPAALLLHRSVIHDVSTKNQKANCAITETQGEFAPSILATSPFRKGNDQKQWNCDVCTKSFTTKYFLKKHKRLHTGEMPYSCNKCSKTFTFQQSYHKHLLYHNDEKPHTCSHCGRSFKELSTLHNHQRIHTGEKPFACETCGKAFRQRVSYLVHRRIHTGAMPYKCTACEKSFRYKVSQRTHKCPAQTPGSVVRQQGELLQKLLSPESTVPKKIQKEMSITVQEIESHSLDSAIDTPEITNIDNIVAESYDNMLLQTDNVNPNYTVTFQEDSPEPKNQNFEDADILTLYECSDSLETINEEALKKLLQDE